MIKLISHQLQKYSSKVTIVFIAFLTSSVWHSQAIADYTIPAVIAYKCDRTGNNWFDTYYWLTKQEAVNKWGENVTTIYPNLTSWFILDSGGVEYCEAAEAPGEGGYTGNLIMGETCSYDTLNGRVTLGTWEARPEGNLVCNGQGDCPEGYMDDGTGTNFCVEITLESDAKQERDCSESNPTTGNPIIVATGNKFQTETDYQSNNPFGLSFSRYYNSSSNILDNGLGLKWHHGILQEINDDTLIAQVGRANGQTFVFNYDAVLDTWIGDVDVSDTLVELKDGGGVRTGWEYRDSDDNVEVYNVTGQLLSITNRAGQSQTLEYDVTALNGGDDNSTTLDKVTGFAGEVISLSYDSASSTPERIIAMTDPEGNVYSYNYGSAGNLISVVYPDETPLDDTDNPTRTYHYEDANFPSHLTGITDETGTRYVTWTYDSEGRAISSEHTGGVDKSTLNFNSGLDDEQATYNNDADTSLLLHFDGNSNDASTNNSLVSCAGSYQAGKVGQAISAPCYISNDGDYNFGTNDFTVELWFNKSTYQGQSVIDFRAPSSAPPGPTLGVGGTVSLHWYGQDVVSGGSVELNTWHHLAISRENGIARLFLDGKQIGNDFADTDNYQLPASLNLGANAYGAAQFDGLIDEVRISNTARYTSDFSTDQVTVTNPLGKDTTYHFTTLHDVKKVTQVEGHATASCAGANQNYTYDANGYMASKTDWQGNVTTYVHDARGLETSRTEASGTPEARTVTTTWHPTFRLPLTITEPGKVTTFTYDASGRQLSRAVSTP